MAEVDSYFLSYARADEAIVLPFANGLIAAGVSLWIDQYEIRPSQHWDRTVEAAVRACSGILVMLSPRSVASANVLDEVSVAINDGKHVIPVLIERCAIPLRLTRMQFIDATEDRRTALERCVAHISGEPSPAPVTASHDGPVALSLPPADVQSMVRALAFHLGPIAAHLVERESRTASSRSELCQRLAARLADGKDRAAFLKAVGAT